MSMKSIPPRIPFYIEKTGVSVNTPSTYFLYLALKHKLWVLVRTAVLMCTYNQYFEQKYHFFLMDFFFSFLQAEKKNLCVLHGHVFVM